MRVQNGKKTAFHRGARALAIAALFFCAPLAQSEDNLSQTDAQKLNAALNHEASDKSLQNSTVYAMRALMDLAHTNIPSAVNNGLSAYGRYRNSEGLDRLSDINVQTANSMASISGNSAVTGNNGPTNTSFRRLDPSFLRQGEAAQVAAQFERETGMKREDFLQHLSAASEQKIRSSDPQLFDKALSRLESFVSKIPNQQFRANLEKNIARVPNSVRKGLVAQAVSKFAGYLAGGSPASSAITDSAAAAKVAAAVPAAAKAADPGQDNAGLDGRAPAAVAPAANAPTAPVARDQKASLDNVVQAALDSSNQEGELTLFQQVSRRYRALTPGLTKAL